MIYEMKVIVKNLKTSEKTERILECKFVQNEDDYGNGYYLWIDCPNHSEEHFPNLDIRYDTTFDSERMGLYLATWAYNYWSGENGSWKLKELTIKEQEG